MAVQRFNLLPEEEQKKEDLVSKIKRGEINPDNFSELPEGEQEKVNDILFDMASSQIDSNEGASTLEFILMSFIRIAYKKMNNVSLNSEDVKVEESLRRILNMHQITNEKVAMKDWLFDYMSYAEYKTAQFLQNREEHIERKKNVTGEV